MEEIRVNFRLSCVDANEERNMFRSYGSFDKDEDLTNESE
jgi:hypothetical protein